MNFLRLRHLNENLNELVWHSRIKKITHLRCCTKFIEEYIQSQSFLYYSLSSSIVFYIDIFPLLNFLEWILEFHQNTC